MPACSTLFGCMPACCQACFIPHCFMDCVEDCFSCVNHPDLLGNVCRALPQCKTWLLGIFSILNSNSEVPHDECDLVTIVKHQLTEVFSPQFAQFSDRPVEFIRPTDLAWNRVSSHAVTPLLHDWQDSGDIEQQSEFGSLRHMGGPWELKPFSNCHLDRISGRISVNRLVIGSRWRA